MLRPTQQKAEQLKKVYKLLRFFLEGTPRRTRSTKNKTVTLAFPVIDSFLPIAKKNQSPETHTHPNRIRVQSAKKIMTALFYRAVHHIVHYDAARNILLL